MPKKKTDGKWFTLAAPDILKSMPQGGHVIAIENIPVLRGKALAEFKYNYIMLGTGRLRVEIRPDTFGWIREEAERREMTVSEFCCQILTNGMKTQEKTSGKQKARIRSKS